MKGMKGIILAGGAGTRLYPLTKVVCKQLLPVYDKPMVYYSLSVLLLVGIKNICIISTPKDIPMFKDLMGDGKQWGISIEYVVQERPDGIAQSFILAEDFIDGDDVSLILGDNIFYGDHSHFREAYKNNLPGATIFGYRVSDPKRYGVVAFDETGKAINIEEKPNEPKSSYAVPGYYIYDNDVVKIAKDLKPSARGELEITDVNMEYLKRGQLRVVKLGRGMAWLDTGTTNSLMEASLFIEAIEKRQGLKVCCPEEIAYTMGYITKKQMMSLISDMKNPEYKEYLWSITNNV